MCRGGRGRRPSVVTGRGVVRSASRGRRQARSAIAIRPGSPLGGPNCMGRGPDRPSRLLVPPADAARGRPRRSRSRSVTDAFIHAGLRIAGVGSSAAARIVRPVRYPRGRFEDPETASIVLSWNLQRPERFLALPTGPGAGKPSLRQGGRATGATRRLAPRVSLPRRSRDRRGPARRRRDPLADLAEVSRPRLVTVAPTGRRVAGRTASSPSRRAGLPDRRSRARLGRTCRPSLRRRARYRGTLPTLA